MSGLYFAQSNNDNSFPKMWLKIIIVNWKKKKKEKERLERRKSNIHSISTRFPSKRVGVVWSFKKLWKVNVRPGCGPMSLPPPVDFLSGMHITFSASRMAGAQRSHSFSLLNYVMLPLLVWHLQSEKCHCQGSMKI